MLKNKATRDIALLVFMLTFTVVFLVYVFFPGGGDEEKENKKTPETNVAGPKETEKKEKSKTDPQKVPETKSKSETETEAETEAKTKAGTGNKAESVDPAMNARIRRRREKEKKELLCDIMNRKLELQLEKVYLGILQTDAMFETLRVEQLRLILEEQKEPV